AHEDFFLPTLGMRRALHHGSRRANSSTAERASKEAGYRGDRETEKQEERATNLVGETAGGRRPRMERPRGLEPPPTAWQAVGLPLYYGRSGLTFPYNTRRQWRQGPHRGPRGPTRNSPPAVN